MLQTISKCRSVFMSCVLFKHCFIIELFGLMTASLKYTLTYLLFELQGVRTSDAIDAV